MAKELKPIDVTHLPELLSIAEEVRSTGEPRVLKRADEELAILSPVGPVRKRRARKGPLTRDDALFELVGIGKSGIPGGVSGKKQEYLARAYRPR